MICPAVMSGSDIDGHAKTTCGWVWRHICRLRHL